MIGRVQKNGPVVQPQINAELEKVIVMRMKIVPGHLNVEVTIALLMTVLAPFFHQQLIVAMILIQNHVSKCSPALVFFYEIESGNWDAFGWLGILELQIRIPALQAFWTIHSIRFWVFLSRIVQNCII